MVHWQETMAAAVCYAAVNVQVQDPALKVQLQVFRT